VGSTDRSTPVRAEVIEVLEVLGLAHLRADDGRILGVNRQTPGITFDKLTVGARYRCRVTEPFSRVVLCIRDATDDEPVLPSEEFARRAGLTQTALTVALVSGRIFGVEIDGRLMIPAFYLDRGLDARQLSSVTRLLFGLPSGSKLRFFTSPKGSLFGQTPLQALRLGQYRLVRAAALGFAEI
jgi:hypothetical protein